MKEKLLINIFNKSINKSLDASSMLFFLREFLNSYNSEFTNIKIITGDLSQNNDDGTEGIANELTTYAETINNYYDPFNCRIKPMKPQITFESSYINNVNNVSNAKFSQCNNFFHRLFTGLHELEHVIQMRKLIYETNSFALNCASEELININPKFEDFYENNHDLLIVESDAAAFAASQLIGIIKNVLIPNYSNPELIKYLNGTMRSMQRLVIDSTIDRFAGIQFGSSTTFQLRNSQYGFMLSQSIVYATNAKKRFPILNAKFDENNQLKDLHTMLLDKTNCELDYLIRCKDKKEKYDLEELYGQLFFDYISVKSDDELSRELMRMSSGEKAKVTKCLSEYVDNIESKLYSINSHSFNKIESLIVESESSSDYISTKEKSREERMKCKDRIGGIVKQHQKTVDRFISLQGLAM